MRRRTMMGAAAAGVMAAGTAAAQPGAPAGLDEMLIPALAQYRMPALAAAVVRAGRVVAAGAVGTRRHGASTPVTLNDRFHIGSCTKAMTAMLAGMLVDEGRLRWDTTIGEGVPDLRQGMDAGLAGVTLAQLLSHTGGVQPDDDAVMRLILEVHGDDTLNLDGMRHDMLARWRGRPLIAPPGTRFAYANLGYVFAATMIEKATSSTWEELLSTRIFDALRLGTAGIGPQSAMGRIDAPIGHAPQPDGALKPMLAGPNGDVPAVYGPAGAAHLSILDFAAWAGWHAGAGRRAPALVRPPTLARMHAKVIDMPPRPDAPTGTPAQGGYGLGWGFLDLPYTGGTVLLHTGSNGMNLAMILVQPERDFALVLATNRGGDQADQGLRALQEALYRRFASD